MKQEEGRHAEQENADGVGESDHRAQEGRVL